MATAPIIVGLDPSPVAAAVFAHALALNVTLRRPLLVVTSVDMPADLPAEFLSPLDAALESDWREKLSASMQAVLATAPTGAVLEHVVSMSYPAGLLCEIAREHDSPLIMVGSHARAVKDSILGTTAARVVNNADTSVFVCRPWAPPISAVRRLLVGLDGSARAAPVLASALALAVPAQARMTLVRAVVAPLVVNGVLRKPDVDIEALLRENAARYLHALERDVSNEVLCDTQVPRGAAWSAICDAAEAVDADAVVIGAHGYGVVERVLGTTAARVVNNSRRAVLVVKGSGLRA